MKIFLKNVERKVFNGLMPKRLWLHGKQSHEHDWAKQTRLDQQNSDRDGAKSHHGPEYINNKLFTATSATGRKLCANADWMSKGNAASGDGVLKGISQAVTDIWNQSMSASSIGKLFPEPRKKSGPGIGGIR